jgi:hypothetical protein
MAASTAVIYSYETRSFRMKLEIAYYALIERAAIDARRAAGLRSLKMSVIDEEALCPR